MRLSFGAVRGDTLICPYHGWTFDGQGQCRHMPAHPDLRPSKAARPEIFGVAEAAGFVWATAGKDGAAFVLPEIYSGLTPVRTAHVPVSVAVAMQQLLTMPLGDGTAEPAGHDDGAVTGAFTGDDGATQKYLVMLQPTLAGACALYVAAIGPASPGALQVLNRQIIKFRLSLPAPSAAA
jgi:hypothetical protein